MAPDVEQQVASSDSFRPAPYGQACGGCARAKTKCFYRPGGTVCERCQRLRKSCDPSAPVRKRKTPHSRSPSPPPSRLEKKLDDLVSILRHQADTSSGSRVSPGHSGPQNPSSSTWVDETSPSTTVTRFSGSHGLAERSAGTTPSYVGDLNSSRPVEAPDITFDRTSSTILFATAGSSSSAKYDQASSPSLIWMDVSVFKIPERRAKEQLDLFRTIFLPTFPLVHLPKDLLSADLQRTKPLLWLVIMALTTRSIREQSAMMETIWRIISQRVVIQQFADMDLLLGIVAFGAWSHYFKREKAFIVMVAQIAVCMAHELGLNRDITPSIRRRGRSNAPVADREYTSTQPRTLEECRAILATFHLASSSWISYRKIEPFEWTPYMDACVGRLRDNNSANDAILVLQVQCHLLINPLIQPEQLASRDTARTQGQSFGLLSALLRQLENIRSSNSAQVLEQEIVDVYLRDTELRIYEAILLPVLSLKPAQPPPRTQHNTAIFTRHQHLQTLLSKTTSLLSTFQQNSSPADLFRRWYGSTTDSMGQLLHSLVVLFRLSALTPDMEPGWDVAHVRQTADIFEILDILIVLSQEIHKAGGVQDDGEGPEKGFWVKAGQLMKVIKALFRAEMPESCRVETDEAPAPTSTGNVEPDISFAPGADFSWVDQLSSYDDLGMEELATNFMREEPWITDMLQYV